MKVAIIDLDNNEISIKSYSITKFPQYLWGIGQATEFLLENMKPNTDPLGHDNYLIFLTGIFNGTNIPFSGRYTVMGKSPLTGLLGEANSGGKFGPELRKTGFDALFIRGIAKKLSIIIIKNQKISIKTSIDLTGLDTKETEDKLKNIHGKQVQIASISGAAEKLVLITGIVTDGGRIAARSGLGAVMGSKNIKAIVVRGTKTIPIVNNENLLKLRKDYNQLISKEPNLMTKSFFQFKNKTSPLIKYTKIKDMSNLITNNLAIGSLKRWGTCGTLSLSCELGDSPIKNWKGSNKDFPYNKSKMLDGDEIIKFKTRKYACSACPIGCGGIIDYKDEKYNLESTKKPEYETLAMLGPNLLNDDLGTIFAINDYCNKQGLDTIAIGAILAFVIESLENNILTPADLGGMWPIWGKSDYLLDLVEMIANRQGIGDLLAEGVEKAAEKIGNGTIEYAIAVKNQALPAHDPRYSKKQLLPYIIDSSPGRHTPFQTYFQKSSNLTKLYPELDKEKIDIDYYNYGQVLSTLGVCLFSLVTGCYPVVEFVNALTGMEFSIKDLLTAGERILTAKHLFNLREGYKPLLTRIPKRVLGNPPLDSGLNKGISLNYEKILQDFLEKIEWDEITTIPKMSKLKELEIEHLAKSLIENDLELNNKLITIFNEIKNKKSLN